MSIKLTRIRSLRILRPVIQIQVINGEEIVLQNSCKKSNTLQSWYQDGEPVRRT